MAKLRLPKGLVQRGKKIYANIYDPGKKRTLYFTTGLDAVRENIADAKAFREAKIKELHSAEMVPAYSFEKENIGIRNALEKFKEYSEAKDLSVYEYAVDRFIEAIGEKPVRDITINDSDSFRNYLKNVKNHKQNTRADYTHAIHTIFNYLKTRGFVDNNVIEVVKRAAPNPKAIPKDDLSELFSFIKSKNINGYRFIKTLVTTGLRPKEAVAQHKSDIKLEKSIIAIRDGKHRDKIDYMPMTDEAKEHYLEFINDFSDPEEFIHLYRNPQPKFFVRAQFSIWREQRYNLYQLRKTFITNLVLSGISPYSLMAYARHKKIQTSIDCYTELNISTIGKEENPQIRRFNI